MREELGFVGGHVDVDRALALAALAGEAQVEGLLDLLGPPAVLDPLALAPLEEQARPSARRVLLLACDQVARAHRPRVVLPAFTDADAAEGRPGEAALVLRKLEVRGEPGRVVGRTQAKVGVHRVWIDDLAWIHLAVRVPDRLELPERPDEVVAEHLGQARAARLAIAVLAG